MKLALLLVVWILLTFSFSRSCSWEVMADNEKSREAEKLLRQAEELTDIRSPGSHSFSLTARVVLYDEKGQTREGTYNLLWKSPTAWRDEIRLADFSQVRVADVDKLFVSRNPPSLEFEIFRLLRLLDFPNLLRFSPEARAQNLHEKNRNGSRERTVELALTSGSSWKMIFLAWSSPIPTRVEYKGSHSGYQFQDYEQFDGHQFPHTLIEFDSKKPVIQIQVQELAETTPDASSLVPPPDARWMHWCQHLEHARRADMGKIYPIPWPLRDGALRNHVAIYGVIGTDGQWHNLAVVKSAGKEVDSYWIDEMHQERFYPARCGVNPVEQESVIELYLP